MRTIWARLMFFHSRYDIISLYTWTVMMATPKVLPKAPSARWTSYDGWDWGGMKERLELFMGTINKQALVEHANVILS